MLLRVAIALVALDRVFRGPMCVSHRNYLLLLLWSLVCAAVDGWTAPILLGTTSNRRHPSWASGALSTTTTAIEQQESSATSSTTRILTDDCDFVKPDRDFRQYRWIELPNHLQALIVSDNITGIGVEAASVHVQAGHFDDTIPGLAHFHEHLLFLGTEKYPSEDDYEAFLSRFGGFSNAYTDMEDTNYYFCVTTPASAQTSSALLGGLDRLAQFFISPLFNPNAVERELQSIDSEYRNGKTSDAWRNFQLLKSRADPAHPFTKFGCGNYETLTSKGVDTLLQELQAFWKKYYTASNMRLAVVGHGSLDALQHAVEQTFGALPVSTAQPRRQPIHSNQNRFPLEHAIYGSTAFGPRQLALTRYIVPLTEMRTIKLYFQTPPLEDPHLRLTKPYRVISHLLGHEALGTLHDVLNEQGFITDLSSGIGLDVSDFSLFSITLALTPKGMTARQQILDWVFHWISLIRQHQDQLPAYHDELKRITDMSFRFRENGDPTDFCSTAAQLLFDEIEHGRLLCGGSEASDFDAEITETFLDRLRPANCFISILNSDLDPTHGEWRTEPLYGAVYREEPLTAEQMAAWDNPVGCDPRLRLPDLNRYIPTDFSLRCDDKADASPVNVEEENQLPPTLLIDKPSIRMWHKMDRQWRVPKTFVRIALLSSKAYQTPRTMTLTRIFQRVLNDDLNSFVYDASIAGCSYRVSCTPYGYRISVRGYSEKLPFLLDTLTTRILSLIQEMKQGDPRLSAKFEKAKDGLLRETKNYRLDPPHEVANYNSRLFIEENVWYLDNYINEMEGDDADRNPLTMAECAQVADECFTGRIKCEALCMGNIDEAGAQVVAEVIDRHFLEPGRPLSEAETPRFRSLKLPTRSEAVQMFGPSVQDRQIPLVYQDVAYSGSEENNAVEFIIQAGSELELGYNGVAVLDLITHMAYNSAYNQLRTKEQLGYIVSSFARKTAGSTWGMSIVVQGGVALPERLEERIEAWLDTFRDELRAMPEEDMVDEASAVVAQLLETDTKMSQEASRVFGEILNTEGLSHRMDTPAFDRLERLAYELTVADEESGEEGGLASASFLKEQVLKFFDEHFSARSANRRAMSARVYSQKSQDHYDAAVGNPGILSSYSDMRHYKQYLSSWSSVPYWRVTDENLAQQP